MPDRSIITQVIFLFNILRVKMQKENSEFVDVKDKIKARKLWPYGEALKVLKRHNFSTDYVYTFETGFGPSGFPHIGTFGEIVRTEFIINSLKEFGFKSKIIAFSDDLDGLRKVPDGMPGWIKEHLGKPVSSIPDPFEKFGSFSEHMNDKLKKMLEWLEIDYEFKSSRDTYEKGTFDEALKTLLTNFKTLEDIIAPTLSKETLANWYPFFPICENCGKILTTVVNELNTDDFTVKYTCNKPHDTVVGCGHEGVQTVLSGHGKMTWRVDWPLRWFALDIDYELYGKDLIESFDVGKKIMKRIFKAKEPENMFYEMFLDENGAKISKSKGKGLTVEEWLKYGNLESLYLLMFRRPRQAKELSYKIIPSYVDDSISFSKAYHRTDQVAVEHDFNFITNFKAKDKKFPDISYMLICNLMTALKSTDIELIRNYLSKQKSLTHDDLNSDFFNDLVNKASQYYYDLISKQKHAITFSMEEIFYLGQFIGLLHGELTGEDIHNSVYNMARANDLEPQKFFKIIYTALIGHDRGPRLGSFVEMIGQEKTIEIAKDTIKSFFEEQKAKLATNNNASSGGEADKTVLAPAANNMGCKTATKKLYYDDLYMKEFKATVTKVDGDNVFVNQTAFYPKSGGQIGDVGIIGDKKVLETLYVDGDIAHKLENVEGVIVGKEVECQIDWDRRYKIMRLHSASHIMEYYLSKVFKDVTRLGSTVDDSADRSTYKIIIDSDQMTGIEKSVNDFIRQNSDIVLSCIDEDKEIRLWEAGEIKEYCGGTHPKSCGDIGGVQIKRKSGGKGTTKIITKLVE